MYGKNHIFSSEKNEKWEDTPFPKKLKKKKLQLHIWINWAILSFTDQPVSVFAYIPPTAFGRNLYFQNISFLYFKSNFDKTLSLVDLLKDLITSFFHDNL